MYTYSKKKTENNYCVENGSAHHANSELCVVDVNIWTVRGVHFELAVGNIVAGSFADNKKHWCSKTTGRKQEDEPFGPGEISQTPRTAFIYQVAAYFANCNNGKYINNVGADNDLASVNKQINKQATR